MSHHDKIENALRYRRNLRSGTAIAAVLLGCIGPAWADESIDDSLSGLQPITSDELGKERGGFSIGTVNVSFGFSLSTSVSGGALGQGVTVTTNFTVSTPGNLKNLGTTITSAVEQNLAKAGIGNGGNPATPTLGEKVANTVDTSLSNSLSHLPEAAGAVSGTGDATAASTAALANIPAPSASNVGATNNLADVPPVKTPDLPISVASTTPTLPAGATPKIEPTLNTLSSGSLSPATSVANSPNDVPLGDRPPTPSAIVPTAQVFTAQMDNGGSVSLSAGGTSLFLQTLQGQLSLIQNTENDVHIKSNLSASYIIENYHDIADMAGLHQQLSNLAQQLLALQGLGHQ